ncbi:MAG: hypothetical protein JWO38_5508, partial [Gemmataceae bacterium]|nr:hypothetical protein [Gemmataceae bacterium]
PPGYGQGQGGPYGVMNGGRLPPNALGPGYPNTTATPFGGDAYTPGAYGYSPGYMPPVGYGGQGDPYGGGGYGNPYGGGAGGRAAGMEGAAGSPLSPEAALWAFWPAASSSSTVYWRPGRSTRRTTPGTRRRSTGPWHPGRIAVRQAG